MLRKVRLEIFLAPTFDKLLLNRTYGWNKNLSQTKRITQAQCSQKKKALIKGQKKTHQALLPTTHKHASERKDKKSLCTFKRTCCDPCILHYIYSNCDPLESSVKITHVNVVHSDNLSYVGAICPCENFQPPLVPWVVWLVSFISVLVETLGTHTCEGQH